MKIKRLNKDKINVFQLAEATIYDVEASVMRAGVTIFR